MEFVKNGSEYITNLIAEGIANGTRTATVTGNYEIQWAVRIPSRFTLILADCHLRMADGVYANMFVNENHDTPLGETLEGTQHNISIIGKGRAILDGGNYNGLSEKTHSKDGLPHVTKNCLVMFSNVDGIRIRDIACHNQRYWALNFIYCCNGHISGIDFKANDLAIDPEGNEYHGLIRSRYKEVVVKNADGIDLRQGCHHFLIEDITGFTEDDTIALTNLNLKSTGRSMFAVEGASSDICHVLIRNVRASAYCTIVRLLNQGPVKIHDITVEDVFDTSADCPHLDHGKFAIRVGDAEYLYGERHSTAEETYNIKLRNITGRGYAVLHLAGAIGNISYENISAMGETELLQDRRTV